MSCTRKQTVDVVYNGLSKELCESCLKDLVLRSPPGHIVEFEERWNGASGVVCRNSHQIKEFVRRNNAYGKSNT